MFLNSGGIGLLLRHQRDSDPMSQVNSGNGLRRTLWPRTIVGLVLLNFGVGCETKPTTTIDPNTTKSDPRSPRIKKRDQLHPEGTTKKTTPSPVRKR